MNIAMRNVHNRLVEEGMFPETAIILQVHDEIMVETPEENMDKVVQILDEEMTDVIELRVPITVDIDTGDLWSEAK